MHEEYTLAVVLTPDGCDDDRISVEVELRVGTLAPGQSHCSLLHVTFARELVEPRTDPMRTVESLVRDSIARLPVSKWQSLELVPQRRLTSTMCETIARQASLEVSRDVQVELQRPRRGTQKAGVIGAPDQILLSASRLEDQARRRT
jgi:hypothetical protein